VQRQHHQERQPTEEHRPQPTHGLGERVQHEHRSRGHEQTRLRLGHREIALRGQIADMRERGLLDDRTTIVHGNGISDDQVAMLADAGCSVSISPDVELKMGFGWPETGRMLAAGSPQPPASRPTDHGRSRHDDTLAKLGWHDLSDCGPPLKRHGNGERS
jgi:hypothetical protein